jgi:hypothetical protein
MIDGAFLRVGAVKKNSLDVLVIKKPRTIHELVQHPRRQEIVGRFR